MDFFIIFSGSISTADGSALVKLGNTTVICGIKAVGLIYVLLRFELPN